MPTPSLCGDSARWSGCRMKMGGLLRRSRERRRKSCGKRRSVLKAGAAKEDLRRAKRLGNDERGTENPPSNTEDRTSGGAHSRQKVICAPGISCVRGAAARNLGRSGPGTRAGDDVCGGVDYRWSGARSV